MRGLINQAPQPPNARRCLCLLSGGLDSATLVALYLDQGWKVECLFVDFGQHAVNEERTAAHSLAATLSVAVHEVRIFGLADFEPGRELVGRNALLLATALTGFGGSVDVIAMGIHENRNYWDTTESFAAVTQDLLDGYTAGSVRFGAPFVSWSKKEILQLALSLRIPVDKTYSCDVPLGPCGKCGSCRDLAFASE